MAKDPIADQTLPTREAAERVAKLIGCEGAHRVGDAWQPCESAEGLTILIRDGAAGYRAWKANNRGKKKVLVKRVIAQPEIEEELRNRPKRKRRRKPKKQWEELGEHGVQGIDRISAGIVSGSG